MSVGCPPPTNTTQQSLNRNHTQQSFISKSIQVTSTQALSITVDTAIRIVLTLQGCTSLPTRLSQPVSLRMPSNDHTLPLVCRPGKLRFGIIQQVETIELDYPCVTDPAQFKLLIEPANQGTHVVPGMPTRSIEIK